VKIPKGAKLVMQVHYHRNGAPQSDTSKMALYFSKEPIHKVINVIPVGQLRISAQARRQSAAVKASLSVPTDVHVYTMFPHMHLLGKSMDWWRRCRRSKAVADQGERIGDFNWQETYEYKKPIALPAGTG